MNTRWNLRTTRSEQPSSQKNGTQSWYGRRGKRALDLAVSVPLAIVAAPVVAVSAVLVKVDSPGPAFFTQTRVGRDERTFVVFKLRTMGQELAPDVSQHDMSRVTHVGKILRRLKLDELPQLANVVLGDMSLVGPRPCIPETLDEIDDESRARFLVRPGLTGLAQVSGNTTLDWPARWRLDRSYVENLSLKLDAEILARTALVVLFGEQRFRQADA